MQNPYITTPERDAYEHGRRDQADECSQEHMVRIADVLDAIHKAGGDVIRTREQVLESLGYGGPR